LLRDYSATFIAVQLAPISAHFIAEQAHIFFLYSMAIESLFSFAAPVVESNNNGTLDS